MHLFFPSSHTTPSVPAPHVPSPRPPPEASSATPSPFTPLLARKHCYICVSSFFSDAINATPAPGTRVCSSCHHATAQLVRRRHSSTPETSTPSSAARPLRSHARPLRSHAHIEPVSFRIFRISVGQPTPPPSPPFRTGAIAIGDERAPWKPNPWPSQPRSPPPASPRYPATVTDCLCLLHRATTPPSPDHTPVQSFESPASSLSFPFLIWDASVWRTV